jgi:hypothetical protein
MVLKPRQSGIVAICDCGTKQFIPSESAIRTGLLYCPCGHLEKIDMKVFNQIMCRHLKARLPKKAERLYRPLAREERTQIQILFEPIG